MSKKNRAWTHTTPEAIEAWKVEQRLSWGRVAELFGVAVETIRMWRKRETVPSATKQQAIVSAMGGAQAPAAPVEMVRDSERKIEQTRSGRLTINLLADSPVTAEDIAAIVLRALRDANITGVATVTNAA